MSLDYNKILNWHFDDVIQSYTEKDCMLYALGLGLGHNPTEPDELKYVYEKDLATFPTMGLVLGYPGQWMANPETGIDVRKVLHADQAIEIIKPLPTEGTIRSEIKVIDIIDKGADKGALIVVQRKLFDHKSGELYCIQRSTAFARGNGGFGGHNNSASVTKIPDRKADTSEVVKISPQAALLYRLSGDYNILHADPEAAKKSGFATPILHGLASYGIAAFSVLKALNIDDSTRLKSFFLRFSSPVFPGETLRTDIWDEGGKISFRSTVLERNVVALDIGLAVIDV